MIHVQPVPNRPGLFLLSCFLASQPTARILDEVIPP